VPLLCGKEIIHREHKGYRGVKAKDFSPLQGFYVTNGWIREEKIPEAGTLQINYSNAQI